jgi:DNA-directed RNA polymerase sigma subunit (sigma70/sigma32)
LNLKKFLYLQIANLYIKHTRTGLPPRWLILETLYNYTLKNYLASKDHLPPLGRRLYIMVKFTTKSHSEHALLSSAKNLNVTRERIRQIVCREVYKYLKS